MSSLLSRYALLAKRWAWMVLLGIALCSGATYIISELIPPVYQATATLIVTINSSAFPSDNIHASELAVSTYAQLLTDPAVLEPVVAQHQGMALNQLDSMISVKPLSNTQLIELDVKNSDPQLAVQLANEICQSFVQFSQSKLSGTVQIVPAKLPTDPIGPKPLQNTGIGALVGLGLALTLIVIFEWIDDLPTSLEDVQELLGMEILAVIPQLSRKQRQRNKEPEAPFALVEGYHLLCTSLHAAQAVKPFKMVMITSALAGEGKSTVAAHLACLLAKAGKSVLLVDANLRHPMLHQHFQLDKCAGLSELLLKMETLSEEELYGQTTNIPTLHVLQAGILPTDPAELLQSIEVKQLFNYLKQAPFDTIIFDTPPLLPLADAQILALHIPTILMVVDGSRTSRRMLLRAKSVLKRTHTTILGVALNKSHWSDYGAVYQYLSHDRQLKTDTTTTTSTRAAMKDDLMDATDDGMDSTTPTRKLQKVRGQKQ